MKKDIEIPSIENIYIATINERNEIFNTDDWNVYIINDNSYPVEQVIIVSNSGDKTIRTSTIRHRLKLLPAKSFAKVELLTSELLKINNKFSVSYFAENTLYHHTFILPKYMPKRLKEIPLINKKGLIAK